MYKVDRRLGCVAVIDTRLVEVGDWSRVDLRPDDKHVFAFWNGILSSDGWSVPDSYIKAANNLCEKLNIEYEEVSSVSRTKKQQYHDIKHKEITEFVFTSVWNGKVSEHLELYPEDAYMFEHYQKLFVDQVDNMMFVWESFKDEVNNNKFAEYVKSERWSKFLFLARKKGGQPTDYMKGLTNYDIIKYMSMLK